MANVEFDYSIEKDQQTGEINSVCVYLTAPFGTIDFRFTNIEQLCQNVNDGCDAIFAGDKGMNVVDDVLIVWADSSLYDNTSISMILNSDPEMNNRYDELVDNLKKELNPGVVRIET